MNPRKKGADPTVKDHTPYPQGEFDGLCGLYAIVNARVSVHGRDPKGKQTDQAAFKALASGIQARTGNEYRRRVLHGLSLEELQPCLAKLLEVNYSLTETFAVCKFPNTDTFQIPGVTKGSLKRAIIGYSDYRQKQGVSHHWTTVSAKTKTKTLDGEPIVRLYVSDGDSGKSMDIQASHFTVALPPDDEEKAESSGLFYLDPTYIEITFKA